MIVVSHPTGNQNVRQLLLALHEAGLLSCFHTTISWQPDTLLNLLLPPRLLQELNRRSYPSIPQNLISTTPLRESVRLLCCKFGIPLHGTVSFLKIEKHLDGVTANTVRRCGPRAVYAYEGVALQSFRAAIGRGAKCIYELPSGYWYHEIELLREEAELRPEYAGTIEKLKETPEHLDQKDEELASADQVIVPSTYVTRTLARAAVPKEKLHVIPYAANDCGEPVCAHSASRSNKLRVIFVGALSQRKGIGYALEAVELLSSRVEFTMVGMKVGHSPAIDRAVQKHRWIPSLPHSLVLDEIAKHDVLLLPSLSEGFGLAITEALSRSVPVITTHNSGGPDVIRDGVEGFLIPIRSSEAIAERLHILDRDRERLGAMSSAARDRARVLTWERYRRMLRYTLEELLSPCN
jgi:starch synthase